MQYKTIIFHLLQQLPVLQKLRNRRMLLPTLEYLAKDLKRSHEGWKDCLSAAMPGRDQDQIASEAMEIAVKEMEGFLHSTYPPEQIEPLSVMEGMVFIRRRTPDA
jgi:hypothetical protein